MDNGYHRAEGERAMDVQRIIDEAEWIILRPRIRSALEEVLTEPAEMLGFLGQLEARLSGEFRRGGA